MIRTTALTLLMLCGLAAAGDTEAEKLYRDAWWRESSQADYAKALETYRKAVEATGPDSVRAKALLKVADLLKRLGKTEEALATLEKLRERFPNESEALATARVRAKEWTAVDLRQSYSEWYRRYMFSPEFQERVVNEVLDLANGDVPESWLLSIGDAAVPALQESAKSRNKTLVQRVIPLLLKLDVIPPARALLDHRDWTVDGAAWLGILRAPEEARRKLRNEVSGASPLAMLVKAAATSGGAVVQALAGDVGARLSVNGEETVTAILKALHATGDAGVHAGIADLAVHPKSPAALRPFAAAVILDFGWPGATATDWIEWSRDADRFEWRQASVTWAAMALQPEDAASIDAILDDIAEVGKVRSYLQEELTRSFSEGLLLNGRVLQLNWSPERLQKFIVTCCRHDYEGKNFLFLRLLAFDRTRGGNLLEAFLLDPEVFAPKNSDDEMGSLPEIFYFDGEPADEAFAGARWRRWAKRAYLRKWGGWSESQRAAALFMAYYGLVGDGRAQRALAKAIDEATEGKVTPAVESRLKDLRERELD